MEEINVEKIMEEIRAEIKEKGYKDDALSFSTVSKNGNFSEEECKYYYYDSEEFHQIVDLVNAGWNYPLATWKFTGITGKFKKVIYILVRLITRPLFSAQRKEGFLFVRAYNQLVGYTVMQEDIIREQNVRLEALEAKMKEMEKLISKGVN